MQIVSTELGALLQRYKEHLDDGQIESLLTMLARVAAIGGGPTGQQLEMIDAIQDSLRPEPEPAGTWG
jgi:hypothetical protein